MLYEVITFDSYLHEAGEAPTERRTRSELSWWMLTSMTPSTAERTRIGRCQRTSRAICAPRPRITSYNVCYTKLLRVRTANPGSQARNPAFDVTPAALVRAIITERGAVVPCELSKIRQ